MQARTRLGPDLNIHNGGMGTPSPRCFPLNVICHELEVMHHLRFRYMTAPRAEGRRNELRQLMLGEVQRGYLRNLDAHEIRVQATLHGSVAHHDQAPLLQPVGAGRTHTRVDKDTTYGLGHLCCFYVVSMFVFFV